MDVDVLVVTLGSFLISTGFLSTTTDLTGDDAGFVVVGVVGVDAFDVLTKPLAALFTGLAVIGDLFVVVVVVVVVVELGSESCRG